MKLLTCKRVETKVDEWSYTAAIIIPEKGAPCAGLLSRTFEMYVGSLSLWVCFLLLEAVIGEWTVSATLMIFTLADSMLHLKKVVE